METRKWNFALDQIVFIYCDKLSHIPREGGASLLDGRVGLWGGFGLRTIIVHQDTVGRTFHIIELATFYRPKKNPDDEKYQRHA